MAPSLRWAAAEERMLLLLLLQLLVPKRQFTTAEYQVLLNAWPVNPTSEGLSGTPSLRGVQERTSALRRLASSLVGNGGAPAAQVPNRRAPLHTTKRMLIKQDDQDTPMDDEDAAMTAAGHAIAGTMTAATPKTPVKPRAKKASTKSTTTRFNVDEGADTATPTSVSGQTAAAAAAASLPTPTASTKTSNKRKRASAAARLLSNDSNTDSSDEAVSTDACDDDDANSPTPAARKPRTSYARSTKPQVEGTYAGHDGPGSGDESSDVNMTDGIGAGEQWANVMKKRAAKKRVKVVRDDSDTDWVDSELEMMV